MPLKIALMLWLISGHADGNEAARTPPTEPGIHDVETQAAQAPGARFTLSIPARVDARSRAPLVLVLHYAGEPTRFYGRPLLEALIEPAFRHLGAYFVAPESLSGQWHTEANEAFVMSLLKELIGAYDIDSERIVVTGYSMGAIGAWHFVTHYPEMFSAAIPISGFPRRELQCAVPVSTFHAPADELFPITQLESLVADLQIRDCPIRMTKVDARGHFDLQGFRDVLHTVPAWLEDIWAVSGDNASRK
jgi:predicted peptidase